MSACLTATALLDTAVQINEYGLLHLFFSIGMRTADPFCRVALLGCTAKTKRKVGFIVDLVGILRTFAVGKKFLT